MFYEDFNGFKKLMRTLLLVAFLALVHCSICAPAFDPSALFQSLDTDKDGQIDSTDILNAILRYDVSGDKVVTKDEFVQKYQDFHLGNAAQGGNLFALADVIKDGKLNSADAMRLFHDFDQSNDGHVSSAEFVAVFNAAVAAAASGMPVG